MKAVYSDFEKLKDMDEMTLRRLFVERNYVRYINDPMTDDMTSPMEGVSIFPEDTDETAAKIELQILKPEEIENRYLRKRVEAYLAICRELIDTRISNRSRAFCLGIIQEAGEKNFLKGNGKNLNKKFIIKFAEDLWPGCDGESIYNETRSIISDKNAVNQNYKDRWPDEYEFGESLFKQIYGLPDPPEIQR